MKKKRLFKSLVLLFSSSLVLGTFLSLRLAYKKDNINVALAYEGTELDPAGGALSSGTYYIDKDITLTNYITVATGSDVVINLNGFSLSAKPNSNQPVVYVNGGTLTINGKDDVSGNMGTLCNGTGYSNGSYTRGGAIAVYADGTNMGNATVNDCNIANNEANFAGAVFVSKGTTATLNNCNVYNNISTSPSDWGFRGIIYAEDVQATVNINGGEIYNNESGILLWANNSENKSSRANLNGVYIHDNDRFGVRVNGNDNGNPALTIAGDTIIKNNVSSTAPVNLRLNNSNNAKFAIVSELGDNASIGVTLTGDKTGGNAVFTNSTDTSLNNASKFFSDDANYAVAKNSDGQLYLTNAAATVTSGETVTEYNTFDDALSAWTDGTTLTLLDDVNFNSQVTINDTRILDLNGYGVITTYTDSLFLINNGGNLSLNDSRNTTHYFTYERYKGYDAGLATVCDKATYDAASEDSRSTFSGGYITGLHITADNPVARGAFRVESGATLTMNGGTIIGNYCDNSASGVCSDGVFVMNGGNMIYNTNRQGAINPRYGTLVINGGNISHNIGKNDKNIGRGGAILQYATVDCTIRGGTITNNVARQGAIASQCNIAIEGDPLIKDNIAVGEDGNSNDPMNILLCLEHESKLVFIGEFTGKYPIGVTVNMPSVHDITDSTDVSFNNKNNVVYDDPNYAVGQYPSNHAKAGQLFYAKLEVMDVIDAIDNIEPLTYGGGKNDSLDDIIAAKTAYDALTPEQQEIVNEVNKDILDHDIVTYNHVDKVGDLIKAIPEASDSQEYYDAVDAALAAYKALTDEEKAILNADLDFQYKKTLDDNIAAKEVIELIQDIGEVTYKGGQDDSKDDIDATIDAYNNLTDDQKAIVDNANKDELDDAKETYDNVDEAVNLINSIGDINHGGDNDSQEAIIAAREAYDNLRDEEKTLVNSYNDSTQTLEDAEEVYDVLVKIDDAGEGDDEEKNKIAREAYDSLTSGQKEKVSDKYVQKLIAAENRSRETNQQANILFIIFLILFILLIVSGLIVMYVLLKRRKNENNDNNKQVKLASVSGLLPLVILASYFSSTKFIILYVLAAVAILVWLTNLILFVSMKRQKEAKVETKLETVVPTIPQAIQNEPLNKDEEEVETISDEKGNIFQIRFIKSFTAKLIQSPEETKKYYEELKNEVLSYRKTNSRISWHYDAINSGRNYILKFAVRGKTLCVYLPLNVDDYVDSKYKVEKAESKRYEDVPCLYRIKNDRRLGYAKELIAVVAANLGLEKGEEQHEVYSNLPYEPNKPLIARGLIKEQKVQVNKPSEQPVVLESKINSDGDEVIVTKDVSGNIFEIRYIKSFTAKLSQSEDVVKDYYSELKNYALSYKGSHSRVSWHYDAINVGRDYVLKFAIRGKTLCLYYALDVSKLDEKYKVEEAKGKKFEDVPCLYRIKNERRLGYAKELIDLLMSEKAISKGREQNEDYHIPSESTKALLAKGLIKEVKSKVQDKEVIKHYESISVSKADEEMSDEKAESSLEEVEVIKPRKGSKEIINIDTLSENYNNGDEVTLESLIKKGLVPATTGHIKILARGVLDKKFDVIADDFSIPAIKMIVLVGGHVKKIK